MTTKTLSFAEAVRRVFGNRLVLCNNISSIDDSIWDNIECGSLYDSEDEIKDIFQYFITGASNFDIEYAREYFPSMIISYSDKLDNYILLVDHYGTSWDNVDIEYTGENL